MPSLTFLENLHAEWIKMLEGNDDTYVRIKFYHEYNWETFMVGGERYDFSSVDVYWLPVPFKRWKGIDLGFVFVQNDVGNGTYE